MASSIIDRLKEKKALVREKSILISLHTENITPAMKATEQNLRDKLDFRLLELEEQGLDAKINTMDALLAVLHKRS